MSESDKPLSKLESKILPIETRKRIRLLIHQRSEKEVAAMLGLSVNTVCRALAQMPLTLGTIALINQRLEKDGQ